MRNKLSFFRDIGGKVPFGSDEELLKKALEELGFQNKPVSQIDFNSLSKKMIELHNKPISDALEQQQLDHNEGLVY